MTDRVDDFVVEAREHLATVEAALLALEKQPDSVEASALRDRCFRSIHSIKGDAGFLGLSRINKLAHAMESLLGETQSLTPKIVETLLGARDRLAVLVDSASQSHQIEIDDVLQRLAACETSQSTVPIEIDLAGISRGKSAGLCSIIGRMVQSATIRDGRLEIKPCDLHIGLPIGPVHWQASAQTALTIEQLLQQSGLSLPSPPRNELLTADLTQWSQTQGGLVAKFVELAKSAKFRSGKLVANPTELRRGLPQGPIIWSAEAETALSKAELSRRFGLVFPQDIPAVETASKLDASEIVAASPTGSDSTTPQPSVVARPVTPLTDSDKSSTLRINVELLDRLMTLVGELTLVRNQSLLAFADEDGPQRAIIQRLNSVTSELQDATLRARMQPVGNLFNKFPRMVRDLARQLGKQVELELQGREVELDKTILEQLSDPLMHLIRNSVDHGIELPAERTAKGKPPIGRIVLSATHEDGQVHIQIRDDGKGIDPSAVKTKAMALRLRTEAELERLTPRELYSLILLPGFSTAKQVTEVSGRGVGMDVVKTNIEQLEGTLNIDSAPGLGCSMILRLPLTLAIIPCLIVTVNGHRFAVPQRELEEVVCLHPRSPGRIEQAFDTEVYRLRDKLLPIVRLSDVLDRKEPFTAAAKAEIMAAHADDHASQQVRYILVLRLQGRRFGLVVDEVRGTQEIVVKPMHSSMKRVGIFAGATIMGDGRVALITDADGIIEHARLSFESAQEAKTNVSTTRDAAQAHRVLLFEYGPQEQFALPLLQIRRIEMISHDRVERVGDHEYVTVDGVSTRILRLDKVLNASSLAVDPPTMSLILPKFVQQPMGILVSRIVDTESLALDLQHHPDHDPGILGSAIVRDRLTLFLEMHRLSEKLFGISTTAASDHASPAARAKRLLLIDDTAFFREVIRRYLSAEGYEIVTAVHGEDGLKRLAVEAEFDLIVSDIEMPVMDGWEFAREVRRRGIKTPLLALTSLSGMQYESKAKDCGYDSYEVKLDHDRLVRKVINMLAAHELSA